MTEKQAFSIDLGLLKTRQKDISSDAIGRADAAGENHGFINREPPKRRGRQPSPRTGQIHAKVMPQVADEVAEEATRRGVTQGVVIEEAWEMYKNR